MKRTREESLELYSEWCKEWYGEDCYIQEDYDYMVIVNGSLELFQILSCREDGWLFCGKVHNDCIFTWEGK